MKMTVIKLAVLGPLLALGACGSIGSNFVETRTTVFHTMEKVVTQEPFVLLPWRKELEGSLEFASYAAQVATMLRQKGFNVVESAAGARYVVFLDYGIDDGRNVATPYSIPQFGVTGSSGSTTTGTVSTIGNTSYLRANTVSTPTYGITGYVQGVSNQTVYRRFVNLDIVDVANKEKFQRVLQLQLKSEGSCGALPSVMPAFVEAMNKNLLAASGSSKTENIGWSGKC